ncbi:MAG TPA: DinB family protein [Flexivirga sp.]|uniref:DinB family protein n=1 Tax=Flexivirga sp. TaxID=1962927 RepID=UPI002C082D4A|nr:DinB family protein [Flexivirga sp.]HWC24057.1 DinB family protein [Flexivirga sp.]
MERFVDRDFTATEFRECVLDRARFVGVVMRGAEIDGLLDDLTVNGVPVMPYVETELDRRHPVRVLIRSDDVADLREAWRQLRGAWASTVERLRRSPGIERTSVGGEWSAIQTLRHLVFVHDSWFIRCCLGRSESFTSFGLTTDGMPAEATPGLDRAADPTLDEVLAVRAKQAESLASWLAECTADDLARPAPVPDDDVWPPYAKGRTVLECLRTVLNEEFEHHGFAVRDLATLE